MAWIKHDGLAINLDRVQTFWWEREDAFCAHLYLRYGPDNVVKIEDEFMILYQGALLACGLYEMT